HDGLADLLAVAVDRLADLALVLPGGVTGTVLVPGHVHGNLAKLLHREVTGAGHGVHGLVLSEICGQRHPTSSFPSSCDCCDSCDCSGSARRVPRRAGAAVPFSGTARTGAPDPGSSCSDRSDPSFPGPSWAAGTTPAASFSLRNEA